MEYCYDKNLASKLGVKVPLQDFPVMNSRFKPWSTQISGSLVNKESLGVRYDRNESTLRLLNECKKHSSQYEKPLVFDKALVFVHPFYLHLTHMNELTERNHSEAGAYLNDFFKIIDALSIAKSLDVVLIETVPHYAAATSILSERGLINRTIFTEDDNGTPLDERELTLLADKRIFLAGGYNGRCFTKAVKLIQEKTQRSDQIGIRELVVESPQDNGNTLKPSHVECIGNLISLEKIISIIAE